jgi:hypothetical protein
VGAQTFHLIQSLTLQRRVLARKAVFEAARCSELAPAELASGLQAASVLLTAATSPATAAAAATSALAAVKTGAADVSGSQRVTEKQQQQQGLRLQSYSSSLPRAVELLAVLQPHSLVHVDLGVCRNRQHKQRMSC